MATLKELKRELQLYAVNEIKAVERYKKLAILLLDLSSVEAINKKELQQLITDILSKKGLSESSIKKIRGGLMAFYEGAKKFPQNVEVVKTRLSNIVTRQEVEALGRNYKKEGTTEKAEKETTSKPKNKKEKEVVKVNKAKYYNLISSIIKIDEDTYYNMDDEDIIKLIEEVQTIITLLNKAKKN